MTKEARPLQIDHLIVREARIMPDLLSLLLT